MSGGIVLSSVEKSFDGKPVISGLSCEFAPGSVTLIEGASGSGKTTLINLIIGLLEPDGGMVEGVQGLRMGVVFQEDRLLERMNAAENVRFVAGADVGQAEIWANLKRVGLGDSGSKRVSSFSGGMKRRVAIVRALIVKPELLVLDEPFNGLDDESKAAAARYIMEERAGATVIIVTHDQEEAKLIGAERSVALSN